MRKKIAFVVSTPLTAKSFLLDYFNKLAEANDVYLIANFSGETLVDFDCDDVIIIDAPIQRKISLIKDMVCFFSLFKIFRKYKFDIVHSVTPKAGLLSMTASMLAGIKYRFHTFTGQVWATDVGLKRHFFRFIDRIIFISAHSVLVDSNSQRDFLLSESIITKASSKVLAEGSISGVNIDVFSSSEEYKNECRKELGLLESDFVFLFLGRVNLAKGIEELLEAFSELRQEVGREAARLMIVGPDEGGLLTNINESNIIIKGYTNTPNKFMVSADVFCLPSHREGFGSVIIEAAALGVPAIGSDIYGVKDAIVHEGTGLLHKVQDKSAIKECMRVIMDNHQARKEYGIAAKKRAIRYFSQGHVTAALIEFYKDKCDAG